MDKYITNPALKIEYTNDNDVILIFEEIPMWIKTTKTGIEILECFKKEKTVETAIKEISKLYDLPEGIISDSINKTVKRFISLNVLLKSDNENNVQIKLPEVEELGLRQIWINLTTVCNFKCKHCFVVDNREEIFIPKAKIMEVIKEAGKMGVSQIALSGGEPTLHPDFLEILEEAAKLERCSIKLVTNASVGFHKEWKKIVRMWIPYVNDFQVSLDGVDAEVHDAIRGEGSFEQAMEFIKFIHEQKQLLEREKKAHQCVVGLSFTPTLENINSIKKLYKFAFENKVDYIHLNRAKKPATDNYINEQKFLSAEFSEKVYEEYDKMKEEYQAILNDMRGIDIKMTEIDTTFDPSNDLVIHLKRRRCGAGYLTMAINPNGDVFPCAALINRKELLVGNIFDESLTEIHNKAKKLMNEKFSVEKNEKCRKCSYKYFCGGGCRATAEEFDKEDRNCDVIKKRYMKYWESISLPLLKFGEEYCKEIRRLTKHE